MAKLTPAQAREKWQRNLKAASKDIEMGVDRVTESPTNKAADKIDKMRTNLNAAIDSGKVERGLRRVTLSDWKASMKGKGLQRLNAGVQGAAQKVEGFYAQLFPYQESLQAKISNMPDTTLDDNIQRAVEYMRGMSEFERT